MKDTALYNSRLIKNYIEYLNEYNPEVNTGFLLNYASITSYQLEDGGHWFSQKQVDLFSEIQTGDPDMHRKVGLFATLSKAVSPIRQYTIRFMTPATAYSILEKICPLTSRAHNTHTRTLESNQVAFIFIPNPGAEKNLPMRDVSIKSFFRIRTEKL